MTAPLVALAPAKVNLTLRVTARRADGLHELESLVAFAAIADRLSLAPGGPLGLDLSGPLRGGCGPLTENLVLKAARALAAQIPGLRLGHFVLRKRIPVAAGLGGGSADAAAALRLLAEANGRALSDPRLMAAARQTGADVPVCLDPWPRVMRGIGEVLSAALHLPNLPAVLVNPGMALATKDVFAAFDRSQDRSRHHSLMEATPSDIPNRHAALLAWLSEQTNDLEAAAVSLQPAVGKVLAALHALPQCRLARMSGSGATCFALCDSAAAAKAAARALRAAQPDWWIEATSLGAPTV
jgi:4-diphosphocytidyl-2-C-methyl-D-erythritol kinase